MDEQPHTSENLKHKDNLYSNYDINDFNKHLNTTKDIQGWRNKLIDIIPSFKENVNFVDIGCGFGDKTLRLKNSNKIKFNNIFLIDYSSKSTKVFSSIYKDNNLKILNLDVFQALEKIEDNSLDIIIAYGFIHEINNRDIFFSKLKNKMKDDCLLIISDNDLYYSAYQLQNDLVKSKIFNCVYKKIFKIFNIHIFKRITTKNNLPKFIISLHKGRSDNILSVPETYFNNLRKMFKHVF
jgi:2-polyprenyl-3-methyl-5-hydroxy-6-metoxy-1,4-benzoquinol methylase